MADRQAAPTNTSCASRASRPARHRQLRLQRIHRERNAVPTALCGDYLTPPAISFLLAEWNRQVASGHRLARHAILDGKRARFYSVVDLVNQLDAESARGAPDISQTVAQPRRHCARRTRLPAFSADGGSLLFHLISKLTSASR